MTKKRLVWIGLMVGAMLFVTGCSVTPKKSIMPTQEPINIPAVIPKPAKTNGSLYQASVSTQLYVNQKAMRVGDVLTVVLQEKTNATKKASTNTSKSNSVDIKNPTIMGVLPGYGNSNFSNSLSSSNAFTGEGDSSQSNSLVGNITVLVEEVLANGNLLIKGHKVMSINQGDEVVKMTGIVRPTDIKSDNTVLSTLVANAHFTYSGEGAIASVNSIGWLGRFFNSDWWPF